MKRAFAWAVATVLVQRLLQGSVIDLGTEWGPLALALLVFGSGVGMLPGARVGLLAAGVSLALLVPLRGPLASLVLAAGSTHASAAVAAAVVSLSPLALALGRLLRAEPGVRSVGAPLAGVLLGLLAAAAGATNWFPAWVLGALVALLLAALAPHRATPEAAEGLRDSGPTPPGESRWLAVTLGLVLGLVATSASRLLPALVEPGAAPAADVLSALLLPALIVILCVGVLVARPLHRRVLAALGGVGGAVALLRLADHLCVYENSVALVQLTRTLHLRAVELPGQLTDWPVWLGSYLIAPGAAAGLALCALRGRDAAGLLLGAGLGVGSSCALLIWPQQVPLGAILLASGLCLLSAALALFGRWGLLAAPLVLLAFLDWDDRSGEGPWTPRPLAAFDEVRRPGEFGIDAFERTPSADVTLALVPGGLISAQEGRAAGALALTPRPPLIDLGADGGIVQRHVPAQPHFVGSAHEHDEHEDAPRLPQGEVPLPREAHALRIAGRSLHAGDTPTGPDGSVARLTRLLARPGPTLVAGLGAELLAADLQQIGNVDAPEVASAVPLGRHLALFLQDALGTSTWLPGEVRSPSQVLRSTPPARWNQVLILPAPESLPGTTGLLAEETLARLRDGLRDEGRLLAWIDATDLDPGALRARLAAFGAVFGERSAAFVEGRGLRAPFVALLGWRSDAGALTRAELAGRLPAADGARRRVRLAGLEDLSALLLRDGPALAALARDGVRHSRSRPVTASRFRRTGWSAVVALHDADSRLSRVLPGAADVHRQATALLAGLALLDRYDFDPSEVNETLLEIPRDIDWVRFEQEIGHYADAAREDPGHPLLHAALGWRLQPLALAGDYGRFAQAWEQCQAAQLPDWRLALLEAHVRREALDEAGAAEALARAVALRAGGDGR